MIYVVAIYLLAIIGVVALLAMMLIMWICYRYEIKVHIGNKEVEKVDN